jgi:hypothetical protein
VKPAGTDTDNVLLAPSSQHFVDFTHLVSPFIDVNANSDLTKVQGKHCISRLVSPTRFRKQRLRRRRAAATGRSRRRRQAQRLRQLAPLERHGGAGRLRRVCTLQDRQGMS